MKYIKENWALCLAVIILLGILAAKTYNEKLLKNTLKTVNSKTETYKLKDGRTANSVQTVYLDKPQKTTLTKKFADVETQTQVVQEVVIDTVVIQYKDTVNTVFERKGTVLNEDYMLDYVSTQKGITIANLSLTDSLEIVTGTKRKWLFGKTTHTVDIAHSNKLFTNKDIQHFEIVEKKKFYQTTVFKVGVGILAGALIFK